MIKYFLPVFILALLGCAVTPTTRLPTKGVSNDTGNGVNHQPAEYDFKIEIAGSDEFKQQVEKALDLLRQKSPEEYEIVQKYIGKIEENERSGMLAYETPPVYQMSLKTASYSITWCAGTIAHDAYHSKLYHDYKEKHEEPVPYDEWAGFDAEKKCFKFQLTTLNKINAPRNEIDYCISLDGTHSDINQNGKIDWTDYDLRDW